MKPNFFVFCEGKTEIAYVKFLRSLYRVPIQVITKMSKSNISTEDIERSKRDYIGTDQDKVFLISPGPGPSDRFLSMSLLELRAEMGTRGQENGAGQTSE